MACLPFKQEGVRCNFPCTAVLTVCFLHVLEDLDRCLTGYALCQVEHLLG